MKKYTKNLALMTLGSAAISLGGYVGYQIPQNTKEATHEKDKIVASGVGGVFGLGLIVLGTRMVRSKETSLTQVYDKSQPHNDDLEKVVYHYGQKVTAEEQAMIEELKWEDLKRVVDSIPQEEYKRPKSPSPESNRAMRAYNNWLASLTKEEKETRSKKQLELLELGAEDRYLDFLQRARNRLALQKKSKNKAT